MRAGGADALPVRTAHLAATKVEVNMNNVRIYEGRSGWFYEVWIASRLVIFGWCQSRERAEWQAQAV
jgi:hypothetical protein